MTLTIGSLFAGYGGLDLGIEAVIDARTAWVSEIDPGACKVLAERFPHAPNLGDITSIDWATVPPVDIIAGGYPCQPFSTAGRRMGQDDDRHLWPHVRDALAIMRPRLVVFENVRGHLTLGFDEVVRDLHQLGYDIEWRLIRASDIGACHQRARLFILGVNREYRVRSRTDRRGGLDWNPADNLQLPSSDANHDVRQGHPCPTCNAETFRGSDRAPKGTSGNPSSDDLMDGVGRTRRGTDLQAAAPLDRQAGAGRLGAGVPCDADGRPEAPQPRAVLDGGDARPGQDADAAHSGSEPSRAGPRAADPAGRCADCGVSLGLVVGAGGQPVWPGGVRGEVPDERGDDLGARVRTASGADVLAWRRNLADADHAGSQRPHDPQGAAQARLHGHPVAGADGDAVRLLPTPTTTQRGPDANLATRAGARANLHNEALQLLPTPVAQPSGNTPEDHLRKKPGRQRITDLAIIAEHGLLSTTGRLLPTPTGNLGSNGGPQDPAKRRDGGHSVSIEDAVHGLSLLPTPRATDGTKGGPNQRGSKGDLMLPSAVHQLLPTPVVTDAKGARNATSGRKEGSQHHSGTTLTDALVRTNQKGSHHADTSDSVPRQDLRDMREDVQPEAVQRTTGGPGALSVQAQLFAVVREHEERGDEGRPALACQETQGDELRELRYGGSSARPSHRPEPSEQRPREPDDALRLMPPEAALAGGSSEAAGVQSVGCGCPAWGHYAPAIHQHELAFGRIAPPPTEVGPSGKPRLSARAVEWMMGLPAGWVTDIDGVSRASQLRMLGNGVVAQQCAAALRDMLRTMGASA